MSLIELPQKLETFDDLELLLRGDVLQLRCRYMPFGKFDDELMLGAYHSKNSISFGNTLHSVVVPRVYGDTKYLTRYKLGRENIIGFEDGVLIVNADRVPTESFQKDKLGFSELEETLKMAKLR